MSPSDKNGKPTGEWFDGEARILEGEERDGMLKVFRKEYGSFGYSMLGFVGRLRGERQMTAVISIKLQSTQAFSTSIAKGIGRQVKG
jgi:hypothetical protein